MFVETPPWARNVWAGLYPYVTRWAELFAYLALARYTLPLPPARED